MRTRILLTSFQTWLPHQKSNSSDDLLAIIQKKEFAASLTFLRQLPVEIERASDRTITTIREIQPRAIVCCGMAESRQQLTIESNATCGDKCIYTSVDLDKLVSTLSNTKITHDAGKFVCEGLYYRVLSYLQEHNLASQCIFVHVPILTEDNLAEIMADFQSIVTAVFNIAKTC